MIDQTVPQPPVPNTPELLKARAQRALDLYRERRHDIEALGADVYLVPSRTSERLYRVQYGEHETCSCADHAYRREVCKHIMMVGILNAKRQAATRRELRVLEERYRHEDMPIDERSSCASASSASGRCGRGRRGGLQGFVDLDKFAGGPSGPRPLSWVVRVAMWDATPSEYAFIPPPPHRAHHH